MLSSSIQRAAVQSTTSITSLYAPQSNVGGNDLHKICAINVQHERSKQNKSPICKSLQCDQGWARPIRHNTAHRTLHINSSSDINHAINTCLGPQHVDFRETSDSKSNSKSEIRFSRHKPPRHSTKDKKERKNKASLRHTQATAANNNMQIHLLNPHGHPHISTPLHSLIHRAFYLQNPFTLHTSLQQSPSTAHGSSRIKQPLVGLIELIGGSGWQLLASHTQRPASTALHAVSLVSPQHLPAHGRKFGSDV